MDELNAKPPLAITKAEAARELSVSRSTLDRMVRKRMFATCSVGADGADERIVWASLQRYVRSGGKRRKRKAKAHKAKASTD